MNKALFLDRDGIINVDHGYVYQKENFEFVDGIFDLCLAASKKGYLLIIITNQSGIGRGKYSTAEFLALTEWMKEEFSKHDVKIDDVYFCPHHPIKGQGEYLKNCQCRKPEPGLILDAQKKHHIDLQQSVFIGDKVSDMQAAQLAGIPNRLLVAGQYDDNDEVTAQRIASVKLASRYIA